MSHLTSIWLNASVNDLCGLVKTLSLSTVSIDQKIWCCFESEILKKKQFLLPEDIRMIIVANLRYTRKHKLEGHVLSNRFLAEIIAELPSAVNRDAALCSPSAFVSNLSASILTLSHEFMNNTIEMQDATIDNDLRKKIAYSLLFLFAKVEKNVSSLSSVELMSTFKALTWRKSIKFLLTENDSSVIEESKQFELINQLQKILLEEIIIPPIHQNIQETRKNHNGEIIGSSIPIINPKGLLVRLLDTIATNRCSGGPDAFHPNDVADLMCITLIYLQNIEELNSSNNRDIDIMYKSLATFNRYLSGRPHAIHHEKLTNLLQLNTKLTSSILAAPPSGALHLTETSNTQLKIPKGTNASVVQHLKVSIEGLQEAVAADLPFREATLTKVEKERLWSILGINK